MAIYSIMQCSVCRRTKDILQDNIHAAPNQCTITKGCSGFLFPTGETTNNTPTAPVEGLTDWYPRGQKPTAVPAQLAEQMVDMSCSNGGEVTLALNISGTEANAHFSIIALFEQQLTTTIPYSQYLFTVTAATPTTATSTLISGKDLAGKNLRFTTADATDRLVYVLINGIASFLGTTADGWSLGAANQIATNSVLPIGAAVTIAVYAAAPTVQIPLEFSLNAASGSTVGSWTNIRWIEEYDPVTGVIKPYKWWLYTCNTINALSSSARLRLVGIYTDTTLTVPVLPLASAPADFSGIRFLLASPPYDNTDRYLNFFIDGSLFAGNYSFLTTTATITELYADSSTRSEIYPPLQLIEAANLSASYISADTFPTTDSLSSTTPESRFSGTKIIGPV